jgi:Domain of unknown function (DUF4406)
LKVYIAGLVSNGGKLSLRQQKWNAQAFAKAEVALRLAGHEPINPLTLSPVSKDSKWLAVMKIDLRAMLECDAVYALDGWETGLGSSIEVYLASVLGMPVYFEGQL